MARHCELGAVEQVVELTAELEFHAFADGGGDEAVQGEVYVVRARAVQRVAAGVPECKGGRVGEATGVVIAVWGPVVEAAVAGPVGPVGGAQIEIVQREDNGERCAVLCCPDAAHLPISEDRAAYAGLQVFLSLAKGSVPSETEDAAERGVGGHGAPLGAKVVGVLDALRRTAIVAAVEACAGTEVDPAAPGEAV